MAKLAVLNCRQLVTHSGPVGPRIGVEMGNVSVVHDGGMLIQDGWILQTGPSNEIASGLPADTEIVYAERQVCLPGFIDAHTHLVFGGNRAGEFAMRAAGASYQEIAAAGGGILSTVAKTRAADSRELLAIGLHHAAAFLDNGTTTIEAKSGYGLSLEDEIKLLTAIRDVSAGSPLRIEPTLLAAHAFPPEFREDHEGYVRLIVDEILPTVARLDLAKWCDIFVETGYFDAEQARVVLGAAQKFGLGWRMHVDQMRDGGGAVLAAELGAKTADHLEYTPPSAFPALKNAGVMPVLLPGSVFCLGLDRYPDARGMIEAGLPAVLATDFNPGSSPTCSMPFTMSLAMTQMKMSPEEALTACTINAAHSLDLGDEIGSLEAGKRADFTLWPVEDWREIPYWVASLRPSAVYVGGSRA